MQLQGCPRLLVVPNSYPTSSDPGDWGEARRITTWDSCFQGLATPPHAPVLYLAHGHPFNSSCWLPLHFYVGNKKKKGSVYVQPSPTSPGEKEYKLFWQEESERLNKQQSGSVGLELARLGAPQTARTEGQPVGSASRARSPGICFRQENTDLVGPCQLHLSSERPDFLCFIYYETVSQDSTYMPSDAVNGDDEGGAWA